MKFTKIRPKVFFSKEISPEKLAEIAQLLNNDFKPNRLGIKIDMETKNDENNISPVFFRPLVDYFQGIVIDSNSLYISAEKNTKEFSKYFETEILDINTPDDELEIKEGKILKKTFIGNNLKKYDSFIIISNFFNTNKLGLGSLYELSFGLSSKKGKTLQMTGGKTDDFSEIKNKKYENKIFKEASAEVAFTNYNYIKKNAIFINILGKINNENKNNIGIFASTDPVAVDQASVDFVNYAKNNDMIKKIEELEEKYLIDCSNKLGIGNKDYELIPIN